MDNLEFAEKLQSIADDLEKIANSAEADSKQRTEKTAGSYRHERSSEFGFGELGSKPSKGVNPLMDFCLS
jgi:hypothetical protein